VARINLFDFFVLGSHLDIINQDVTHVIIVFHGSDLPVVSFTTRLLGLL